MDMAHNLAVLLVRGAVAEAVAPVCFFVRFFFEPQSHGRQPLFFGSE
jgi:hypothetical protein